MLVSPVNFSQVEKSFFFFYKCKGFQTPISLANEKLSTVEVIPAHLICHINYEIINCTDCWQMNENRHREDGGLIYKCKKNIFSMIWHDLVITALAISQTECLME